jgi:hypothetical protein
VASSEKAMLLAKEEEIAALRLQLDEMARQRPPSISDSDGLDARAEVRKPAELHVFDIS